MNHYKAFAKRSEAARKHWNQFWATGNCDRICSPFYNVLRKGDFSGKSVLEVGCGNLEFSHMVITESRRYVGVDIARGAISSANRYFDEYGSKVQLICGDFANGAAKTLADSFLSIDTMPAFGHDFGRALRNATSALTSGGIINFNVTHTDWFELDKDNKDVPKKEASHGIVFHFKGGRQIITFRPSGIELALKSAGFHSIDATVVTPRSEVDIMPHSVAMAMMHGMEHPDRPQIIMVRAIKR